MGDTHWKCQHSGRRRLNSVTRLLRKPAQAAAAFVPPAVVPPAAPAAAAPAAAAEAIPTMGILRTEERAQIRKARVSAVATAPTSTLNPYTNPAPHWGAGADPLGLLKRHRGRLNPNSKPHPQ